uniref:Alsin Rho guanine nucleotide exchange factor ALS2 n=1 Tax=Oncorhynchus kisutch TaxID=8019 RepID=A0A8C7JW76_ONCKI
MDPVKEESSRERGLLHLWRGYSSSVTPERVLLSRPVLQAALGISHGILLAEGGLVYSFGDLTWRQGLRVPPTYPLLESVLSGQCVVSVAAGSFHCGAVTREGAVYMWGENSSGQCGLSERGLVPDASLVSMVDSEAVPPQIIRILEVTCGEQHTLALSTQHEVWAWGSGCQLGLVTSVFPVWRPQKVEHLAGRHVVQVACGGYHSLALVRRFPAQDSQFPRPTATDKCSQCNQLLFSMVDQEDHVIISHSHYCPLGIELADSKPGSCSRSRQASPARQASQSRQASPARQASLAQRHRASACPLSQTNYTGALVMEHTLALTGRAASASPFEVNTPLGIGSTSRLCDSSKSEGCIPVAGLCEALSGPVMAYRKTNQEVRLCMEEDSLQGKKCSSLTDILLEEVIEGSRRHSLPPLLSHASPELPGRRSARSRPNVPRKEEVVESLPSLNTEVWSWGRGQEGQLGHGDQLPRLQPLCIKSLNGEEVVKVAAGTHHSLALSAQCQVKTQSPSHSQFPYPIMSKGLRVWDLAAGQSHSVFLADGDCCQPILCYSGQQVSMSRVTEVNRSVCLMGYISSVYGGGQSCLAQADLNVMGFISALHELAAADRKYYCRLRDVNKRVVSPLLKKESVCTVLGQTSSLLFQSLASSYSRLCHLTGQHSVSLTAFLHTDRDVKGLVILKHANTFLDMYKEYCGSVGNFLVMGGFQALMKPSCFGKKFEVLRQLSESSEDKVPLLDLLVLLFYSPMQHIHEYARLLLKLATCFDVSTVEYQRLQEGCSKYEALSLSLGRKRKEAETTNQFWRTYSGKTTDVLRNPQRRLVYESSNKSLTLQNAGRFSVNWFILFNDALIHAQVRVTTPEESFTLIASSAQEKAKWLRAINQAVEAVLTGEGSGPGVPAVSRTASYIFYKDLRLKDASYSGRWLSGKPHGKGIMKWPDGRKFTGTFKQGLEDGYGDGIMPNKILNKSDRYQGHWRDGKMHGFGTYRYATGQVYEGSFHENIRQGHGMLSSGKLIGSSSSVFVGQWLQDKKMGYGVFDDITRGEKYMGLWSDDQRQGSGVVVTQFGLYYEGTFSDNKMMGTGLLVSDDDTAFEGEFSEDWTPNGKGYLSMSNGDSIEGLFSGEWTSGLKITGTYMKPNLYEPDKKQSTRGELGRLAVSPEQKWKAVFSECWSRLGCEAPGQPEERMRAWENIAVTLTTGRRDSPELLSRSQSRVLEKLEVIPQHTGPVTTGGYDVIQRYLTKACETPLHPLGGLLETLVTVYRITYIGVGSNRRLLQQAVEEIRSYLIRIFQLVRFLFPDLPDEGGVIHPDPKGSSETDQQGLVVSSSTLLLPVLLPRLYPPLFTLYALDKEREEEVYWDCVLRLNKQPDLGLLAFLGVLPSTKNACFASAVKTLQQISTTFTPSDKLQVIQRTFEELNQEVQALLEGNFLLSMDDLLPLFLYVVLRARMRNLAAEVSLIEDLMDPYLQHGELGLMFTTLKACCFQIQQEKTT